eukprot:15479339-Alexandrium_andersonii.AAC.1
MRHVHHAVQSICPCTPAPKNAWVSEQAWNTHAESKRVKAELRVAKRVHGVGQISTCFHAFVAHATLRALNRKLRDQLRQAKKDWVQQVSDKASEAALKHDLRAVYKLTN